MKKLFMIALAAMSLSMVSCSKSVEDKAKDYVHKLLDAEKAGDREAMKEIEKEAEEWENTLTDEEKEKVHKAAEEEVEKITKEMYGNL